MWSEIGTVLERLASSHQQLDTVIPRQERHYQTSGISDQSWQLVNFQQEDTIAQE
jgi:hypothetical protein